MADNEISSRHAAWLRREVAAWQQAGLVDAAGAAGIVGRYTTGGRSAVIRLVSLLGAAFVGVGLISLVAANVDEMSPATRFAGIVAVWLAAVVVAEALDRRRRDAEAASGSPPLAVGAARLIAVTAYGGTIFQAAQSLQVPAYESSLLGWWALGALVYAYACRGVGPLLVGVGAAVAWYTWATGETADDAGALIMGLLVGAVVAGSVGVAHERGPLSEFAAPWSTAGAVLALIAMFAAALPDVARDGLDLQAPGVVGMVVAATAAVVATYTGEPRGRLEALALVAMLGAGAMLIAWTPAGPGGDDVLTGPELAHAAVGTVCYLATAVWFAVLGALRDRPQLTNLATAALVVFVTVQSFGVFAPLLSGAALFLVLGVVLIAGGLVADRARRRIVEEVAE